MKPSPKTSLEIVFKNSFLFYKIKNIKKTHLTTKNYFLLLRIENKMFSNNIF